MSPRLLRLYPAGFRRAFGDEVAEAYREATEGAGPITRLREALDIVAHALRLRLGVGSAHRGGRLFAATAPFALAATGAYAAFLLASTLNLAYVVGLPDLQAPLGYAMSGFSALTLLGSVSALGGRFAVGARTAFAGVVGSTVCFVIAALPGFADMPLAHLAYLTPPLVIAALPLLCPPDLRPSGRIRTTTGLVALLLWAPLFVVLLGLLDASGLGMFPLWRYVMTATAALVLAGGRALSGIRTPGRFALAAAPFLVLGHFAGVVSQDTVPPCLILLAATGVALRLWRRGHSDPASHA
ncbi:hypothetical protein ACFCXF_33590 [Streptomyces virginiae]|uniref:hypothetical protein n=1 Tax=Streptomyces virginiae TaxID=1961 RepID=UPI000527226A|nr:hypothetical protein [Streptomyces virginiae]